LVQIARYLVYRSSRQRVTVFNMAHKQSS